MYLAAEAALDAEETEEAMLDAADETDEATLATDDDDDATLTDEEEAAGFVGSAGFAVGGTAVGGTGVATGALQPMRNVKTTNTSKSFWIARIFDM